MFRSRSREGGVKAAVTGQRVTAAFAGQEHRRSSAFPVLDFSLFRPEHPVSGNVPVDAGFPGRGWRGFPRALRPGLQNQPGKQHHEAPYAILRCSDQ